MNKNDWNRGYIQVFTGNGRGKTSAALGTALRALGAGYNVFIAQFLKGQDSSERTALKTFGEQIVIKSFGQITFVKNKPSNTDMEMAQEGFAAVKEAAESGKYRMIILDEANAAVELGLLDINELLDFLKNKPENIEIIITGRNAHPEIIKIADLITEMKEIKHYYYQGVMARYGIEK